MGSWFPAAAASEILDTPALYTSTTHTSRLEPSTLTSTEYSRSTGITASRISAVLQPILAPDINSSTALQPITTHLTMMDVAPSITRKHVASHAAEIAGDGRDRVSDVLKVLDRQLDNAISGAQGSVLRSMPTLSPSDADEMKRARELATEAVELVHQVSYPVQS